MKLRATGVPLRHAPRQATRAGRAWKPSLGKAARPGDVREDPVGATGTHLVPTPGAGIEAEKGQLQVPEGVGRAPGGHTWRSHLEVGV